MFDNIHCSSFSILIRKSKLYEGKLGSMPIDLALMIGFVIYIYGSFLIYSKLVYDIYVLL